MTTEREPTGSTEAAADGETVLVLGAGAWGTALAMILHAGGHEVRVWGHDAAYTRLIQERRQNPKFLPGVTVPEEIRFGSDAEDLAAGAGVVFAVVPAQFLRSTLETIGSHLPPRALVVSCAKGVEVASLLRPSEILAEFLPQARLAVLSGPSHAEEVSRGRPTAVVAAASNPADAAAAQRLLNSPRFRTYTGADPIGVEVGGASKNIIAIAAGIADALGFGDNTRAGLMTRGLREMTRLGVALGAAAETFAGLSGIGDLIATCTSQHSRNRAVGLRIGSGETLAGILRSSEKVAEGIETTRSFLRLSRQRGVDVPITQEVHSVLFEGKAPREAVQSLLARQSRDEIQ